MPTLTSAKLEEHIRYWRLQELVEVINSVEDVFADRVDKKEKIAANYKNILFTAMGKCITSLQEIICLVMYGYPDGALSLSRNLYEQFITIAFLDYRRQDDDFDEIVEDYFHNYQIQRCKALKYEAEHCVENDELMKFYESEIEKVRSLAHHKGKRDYWWSGMNVFDNIVKDVQNSTTDPLEKRQLAYLHLFYKRASAAIHASYLGNSVRLGVDSNHGVDTSPQSNGHGVALYLSVISFINVARISFDEFDLTFDKYKSKLNELMIYYKEIVWEAYYNA